MNVSQSQPIHCFRPSVGRSYSAEETCQSTYMWMFICYCIFKEFVKCCSDLPYKETETYSA